MDRNSLIGLVLIGGILIGWLVLNGPSNEEIRKAKQKQDSLAKVEVVEKRKAEAAAKELALKNDTAKVIVGDTTKPAVILNADSIREANLKHKFKDFTVATKGENKNIILENEKVKITFQTLGGSVASVELKEYTRPDKKTKVELFSADSTTQALIFLAYNNTLQVHTDSLYFTGGEIKKTVDGQTITFKLPTANPANYIEYVYSLKNGDYMLNCKVNLVNMQGIISKNPPQ